MNSHPIPQFIVSSVRWHLTQFLNTLACDLHCVRYFEFLPLYSPYCDRMCCTVLIDCEHSNRVPMPTNTA